MNVAARGKGTELKVHGALASGSKLGQYQDLVVGSRSPWKLLTFELVTFIASQVPGALGLFLRAKLYPFILGHVGRGVVFGNHVTFRHPHKIRIGEGRGAVERHARRAMRIGCRCAGIHDAQIAEPETSTARVIRDLLNHRAGY